MSFSNGVERLILKNTSLFPSVTLIFRCCVGGAGASVGKPLGDWS